jgi:hypothetical protein
MKNQPWLRSTGPKTSAGKLKVAANGKVRQTGPHSYRELLAIAKAARKDLRAVNEFLHAMKAHRSGTSED